ncbi:hypothetical protein C1752_09748 [Acaryochloris thomasi RCC1774]|uniref:Fatty acid desaturase domain-containing protein n=1 Tax=Acaryochloris thomasi RCC1774 TaxID=1764569 RepID=A0A2W1JGG3_9CYAN|nr:fatty acid desaturase [Acaryochloris thomasi]PZD70725.1 hypothetical protein C1752_09748 [Acaryochloris thomasi RCC1774]
MVTTVRPETEIDSKRYLGYRNHFANAIAISSILIGYCGGITFLFSDNYLLNALGVIWLSHSLINSAIMTHEFMHDTIFYSRRWNTYGGNLMIWLNGGCYAPFRDLARVHLGHHIDCVDLGPFDLPSMMGRLPSPVRNAILTLEWLYFPCLNFMAQWRSITVPFWHPDRKHLRLRVATLLVIRGALFTVMGTISLKALVLYFIAYTGMVTVIRWIDAFQHTFDVYPIGSELPNHSRAYETLHTFSTPLFSFRYRWVNLLLLNFGYHNVHHDVMRCPWHSLPDLDRELYRGNEVQYIDVKHLLQNYHRFRISRIFLGQGQALNRPEDLDLEKFYGATAVSLLFMPY